MNPFEQGLVSFQAGNFHSALQQFLELPADSEALIFAGICLARLRRMDEAEESLEEALRRDPGSIDARVWLGELRRGKGDYARAVELAKQAIELAPDRPEAYGLLGSSLVRLGDAESAIEPLSRAVVLMPATDQHHHFLGLAYRMTGRHELSQSCFQRAAELAPHQPQNAIELAVGMMRSGRAGEALEAIESGLKHAPNHAGLHSQAAAAFTQIRNDVAAEAHHRRAFELAPQAGLAYALWLVDQGRPAEASAIYERLLERIPELGECYFGLGQCRRWTVEHEEMLRRMRGLLESADQSAQSRMYVHYALAKAAEQHGDFKEAWDLYGKANRLAFEDRSRGAQFNLERVRQQFERVRSCYETLRTERVSGNSSGSPIFIIGMIRSGTTLLDQIISSHPQVQNVGELRFWIERGSGLVAAGDEAARCRLRMVADDYLEYVAQITGQSTRTSDKMPLNYSYAGLIHLALPNARLVHIRRNPLDTCVSIYTTYFGVGSEFVYQPANTVAFYTEYLRMMEYWRENLPPERLFELDYEELVADREPVLRRLLEFCDLPWDNACLTHEHNRSAINTPSRGQARQPIYSSSVGRWKCYEPWLGEFSALSTL